MSVVVIVTSPPDEMVSFGVALAPVAFVANTKSCPLIPLVFLAEIYEYLPVLISSFVLAANANLTSVLIVDELLTKKAATSAPPAFVSVCICNLAVGKISPIPTLILLPSSTKETNLADVSVVPTLINNLPAPNPDDPPVL